MRQLITEKLIESVLNEISFKNKKKEFIMYAGCKTRGYVRWSSKNINLCLDEKCQTCSMMKKVLEDEFQDSKINAKKIK